VAGSTPHQAVENYLAPLRRALSCVTDAQLQITGRVPADEPHRLTLGYGQPVALGSGIALTAEQRYTIIEAEGERGPWKVSTASYIYSLDDAEEREIVAFHWHPAGRSSEVRPHMHLGSGAGLGYHVLCKAHLPTNRVALEDVLRLAIKDLAVEPRRDDWSDVLWRSQSAFETWGTWGQPMGEPPR
jgi:hypothetical protein